MISKRKAVKNMLDRYSLTGTDFKKQKSALEIHYDEFNKNLQTKIETEEGSYMPLIFYCGVGHKKMNEVCRNQRNNEHDQRYFDWYINPLEQLIENAPKIPKEMKLFRFIDAKEFQIMKKSYKYGKEYIREGFTSCTVSTEVPNTLAEQNIGGKYMMILKVPEGSRAIYLRDTIPYVSHGEREIILQRGCKIKVNDIVRLNVDHTVLICELINTL